MAGRTVTNLLLSLVVLGLALIVVKLYDVHPVAEASGLEGRPSSTTTVVGCYMRAGRCEWRALRVTDEGILFTIPTR